MYVTIILLNFTVALCHHFNYCFPHKHENIKSGLDVTFSSACAWAVPGATARARAKCLSMRTSKKIKTPAAKMEWVRCNSCGYYPSSLKRFSIFLTSCGHLVCSKCLEGASATDTPRCLQCRQPCKFVKLGPDSQPGPDVTFYFNDEVSAVKKLLQAAQFQKTNYELGAEMAKRARLLREIKERESRQEKVLADLGETVYKLTVPLANVLGGVQNKAKRVGIQLPLSQEFNCSHPSTPSCSPARTPTAQHHQLHPNSAQLQTPTMRPRQCYSFSPAPKSINQSPAIQQRQQQHSSINASPLSTPPLMSKFATGTPGSADPRITANLMTQSRLQNWSQSQKQQQQQPLRRSPSTGVAMGGMMTPPQSTGLHHGITHSHKSVTNRPGPTGVLHGQHNMHPLNSVHSMHTSSTASIANQRVSGKAQAVAVGRGTRGRVPLTMVPGSVLSQAASR